MPTVSLSISRCRTKRAWQQFAPEKDIRAIRRTMGRLRLKLDEADEDRSAKTRTKRAALRTGRAKHPDDRRCRQRDDADILYTSANLYGAYRLKRVYYSAFSPIPDASRALPLSPPPLMREHRLYQADWLMRFYGFNAEEIVDDAHARARHRSKTRLGAPSPRSFSARCQPRQPRGLAARAGVRHRAVNRIIATRRTTSIRLADLARLDIPRTRRCHSSILVTIDRASRRRD